MLLRSCGSCLRIVLENPIQTCFGCSVPRHLPANLRLQTLQAFQRILFFLASRQQLLDPPRLRPGEEGDQLRRTGGMDVGRRDVIAADREHLAILDDLVTEVTGVAEPHGSYVPG